MLIFPRAIERACSSACRRTVSTEEKTQGMHETFCFGDKLLQQRDHKIYRSDSPAVLERYGCRSQ